MYAGVARAGGSAVSIPAQLPALQIWHCRITEWHGLGGISKVIYFHPLATGVERGSNH